MSTDLFAALRKIDTGVSTSFREHPEHPVPSPVFQLSHSKDSKEHPEHREHVKNDGQAGSARKPAQAALTVPTIHNRDYAHVPNEWRAGLKQLNRMPVPRGAEAHRWAQIVLDAHKLAWGWNANLALCEWSLGSLVGYDPDDPSVHSLVLDIRGGWVCGLRKDERGADFAIIVNGEGTRLHHRRMPDGAAPIWALAVFGQQR